MGWDSSNHTDKDQFVKSILAKMDCTRPTESSLIASSIGCRQAGLVGAMRKKQNFFASGALNTGNIEWLFARFVLAYRLL